VYQLRAANGLRQYHVNSALIISAQLHSDYQAFSLGTWSHEGEGGTDEAQRAAIQGYGGGGTFFCDENVGYGHQFSAQQAVELWNDPVHMGIMLSSRYVDAGGGVSVDDTGRTYFTLDVCVVPGSSTSTDNTSAVDATTESIPFGQTSTPGPDGSIQHEVQSGESLYTIADLYNMDFNELAALNNYTQDAILYPGQMLLIRAALPPTATPEPTFTPTPIIPTATRRPTRTPTPLVTALAEAPQPTAMLSPTPASILAGVNSLPGAMDLGLPSLVLGLVVCGLVLIASGVVLRRS